MKQPRALHLDYETRSRADLKAVGAYRYAADPSTEILLCGVALDDQEPRLWVNPKYETPAFHTDPVALEWLQLMEDDLTLLVYAHNVPFEIAVTRYRMAVDMGIMPPHLDQWRCTMAMARRAALPPSLAKLAIALDLGDQKDPVGAKLIRMFSLPKKDGTFNDPADFPEEWIQFGEYCLQDVRVEREIHRKLKAFELRGDTLETFQLDLVLNERGLPVNVTALQNAQRLIDECNADFSAEFQGVTDLMYTQRDKILEWFKERGYPFDDMQAATVDVALAVTEWAKQPETVRALELKKLLGYAAVTKVTAMLACECGDGLVRGTLLYYGAGTGRWSGRLVQPQNFKRPTIQDTHIAYQMICDGCSRHDLEVMFGNPLEVIASCIRHFIQLPNGQLMLDADYSAVEARIVCWLADQEDALQRFRDGVDSYIDMASVIFNKGALLISKDERWVGKQTVLGCGFGMGPARFFEQCETLAKNFNIQGVEVDMELSERSVGAFREKYKKVKELWWAADRAARNAILHPGKKFQAGTKLWFSVVQSGGIPFLVMKLPSGRNIVYPHPKLEPSTKRAGELDITFYGQLPMKQTWGRVKTYGAKFIENAAQGTAADIMSNGACVAEKLGFRIVTLIHDQALARDNGKSIEDFCAALTTTPLWAHGLPIAAEGGIVPYYLKS